MADSSAQKNPPAEEINPDNHKRGLRPPFALGNQFAKGHGRPKLPRGERERRAFLRAKIQEATPRAIEVLTESLDAEVERDRIRAAEILVSHSLPRQEEVDLDATVNTFAHVDPAQLPGLLRHIDTEIVGREENDSAGNRAGS